MSLGVVRAADGPEFVAAAVRSRRLHRPWAFPPDGPSAFRAYLGRFGAGEAVGLVVRRNSDGALVGYLNLNQVLRGSYQSADVGWAAFSPYQGRGYLAEAVRLLLSYCFDDLGLHRVQASIQPGNHRSRGLAQACGLAREGFSPRYLYLDGGWRDHEHWAITAEDHLRPP